MLKNVKNPIENDWQCATEKINSFLKQDIPRKIPKELMNYSSSMMRCLDISFSIFVVVAILIISIIAYFNISLLKNNLIIILGIIIVPVWLFVLYSFIEHIKRLKVIKNGRLYDANIADIQKAYVAKFQIPVYKLKLKVNVNDNTVICHSYVRDEVISHFYDIMNSSDDNHIEVLYNGSNEVMIPMNLAHMIIVLKMSSIYSFTK